MSTGSGRRRAVALLLEHPHYLELGLRERLSLVRKVESGVVLSALLLHLEALGWVKTGRFSRGK